MCSIIRAPISTLQSPFSTRTTSNDAPVLFGHWASDLRYSEFPDMSTSVPEMVTTGRVPVLHIRYVIKTEKRKCKKLGLSRQSLDVSPIEERFTIITAQSNQGSL